MTQPAKTEQDVNAAVDLARGHLYSFLASAFSQPAGKHFELALDRKRQAVAIAAADLLQSEAPRTIELVPGERSPAHLDLRRAVRQLRPPRQDLIAQHQRVFGLLIGLSAPPNETEYCRSTDSFYRAQEMADIAGFYRAFGLERELEERERCDHISVELDFMARLIEKELHALNSRDQALQDRAEICHEAQRKFMVAHLAWWPPAFSELLRQAAGDGGLYPALADVLAGYIASERHFFDLGPDCFVPQPGREPEPCQEASCCQPADGVA